MLESVVALAFISCSCLVAMEGTIASLSTILTGIVVLTIIYHVDQWRKRRAAERARNQVLVQINALKKFVHVRCSGMYQRARAPIRVKRILGRCACV